MNLSSQFYTVAPLLAKSKLAEIEVNSVPELSEGSGDFGEKYTAYSWEVSISDVESESLKTTSDQMKRVDVTVLFNKGELAYRLRTYRFFQ